MKYPRRRITLIICLIFWSLGASAVPCPSSCKCSQATVQCIGVGLTRIPKGIPLTIQYMDLSRNPGLKLESNELSRFAHLSTLKLKQCALNTSFSLPGSIRYLDLSFNHLSIESIEILFNKKTTNHIAEIYLTYNRMVLDRQFSVFPSTVRSLILTGNVLHKIGKNDLKELEHLQYLDLSSTGLKIIEQGSFDFLKNLRQIHMMQNDLSFIPPKLFLYGRSLITLDLTDNNIDKMPDLTGLSNMQYLSLRGNRLKFVNNLPVNFINNLKLSNNQIVSVNVTELQFTRIDLSNNSLEQLQSSLFPNAPYVRVMDLQNNSISRIDRDAFKGMDYILELYLHRNNLERLPKGIFRNLTISKLSLFENNLKTMDGVLNGMKYKPSLLLLFGNENFNTIRKEDFLGMPKHSQIYISCNNIKMIPQHLDIQADIICSPSQDLVLKTASDSLIGSGFHCKRTLLHIYNLCIPCRVGQYDRAECTDCPAGGFYQDEMASIDCKKCPRGQYVPLEKAPGKSPLECLTCPKGTNTKYFVFVPLGQYLPLEKAPGKSPLECLTCPKGTNTKYFAGHRACPCLDGYARTYRFGECKKCTKRGFECKKDYQELMRGYWMSWSSMRTTSNQSCKSSYISFMQNIDIKDDTYDRQTVRYECEMPKPHKCPMKGSCHGGVNADCKEGYTGVLCAVCSNGFMKNFSKCTKCPSSAVSLVQCIAYFLAFIFICWLMSKVDKIKLANHGNMEEKRTFADLLQSTLKILIGFYQVLVAIIHAFSSIHWPTYLNEAVSIFEFIQFSILRVPALHCLRPNWRMNATSEFWFAVIATFTVPILIFLYFAVKSAAIFCYNKQEFKTRLNQNLKNCLQAIVLYLFATYPLTSLKIFEVLPVSCYKFCTSERNGKCLNSVSYLRSDYSVSCDTIVSEKSIIARAAYTALLLPLGFPILVLFLLRRFAPNNRHKGLPLQHEINRSINSETNGEYLEPLLENTRQEETVAQFSLKIFYGNYRSCCWYWEIIEIARKLTTIIASTLLLQNIKIGLFGCIILSIVFAVCHALMWPMKNRFDNWMQLLSLVSITLNLCYTAMQASKIGDGSIIDENKDEWGMGIMLVTINSFLFVMLFGRFIIEVARKVMRSSERGKRCCRSYLCCCLGVKSTARHGSINRDVTL